MQVLHGSADPILESMMAAVASVCWCDQSQHRRAVDTGDDNYDIKLDMNHVFVPQMKRNKKIKIHINIMINILIHVKTYMKTPCVSLAKA